MKTESQALRPAKWNWIAIAVLIIACAVAPLVAWWEQPSSGEEHMAAGLDGLMAAGCVFLVGVPFAVAALLKERSRRVLTSITAVLYAIPALILVGVLFVYLANRR